ncbi:MAG TPA: N-acetylglucosamine-6-phosphate deacetylase [Pyrinomonadaceae bacterium]|nr:N-acetylglucosamine-6-phosphate deacetylase [Pyrinomonadaceae bacterium]
MQNARVVTREQLLEAASVAVVDGKVTTISSNLVSADFDSVIDLDAATLFPGFVDVHIHGAVGVDTMAASKDDLQRVAQFLAANGVTAWLPTLVPAPASDYQKAVSAIDALMQQQANEEAASGARVLGVHYEGPFVNSSQCGALHTAHFKSFSGISDIEILPTPRAPGAVRMMTLAPEIPGGIELIQQLVDRGWIVSIGHTRAGLEELEQAFAAGARHLTHFMNAMPPLHHRAPGPVGWGLTKHDVTFDVIADGIHVDSLVLKLVLQAKGTDGVTLISDAIAAAGAGDGNYDIWGETISVKSGRTSNAKGSIAGSVITMLDAVKMMRSLGVLEVQIAQMAATNPARLLGLDQLRGSIEVGKDADLVAVDEQGAVTFTMVGGQLAS